MDFLNFILNNWSAISSAILFIISTFYGVKKMKLSSKDYAKTVANSLMLGFEKRALELLNTTDGKAKFKEVVSLGYDKFPAKVRFFVSKPLFEQIVQTLHDEAIKLVESKLPNLEPVVTPVISPTITGTTDAQTAINAITEGLKRLGVNISTTDSSANSIAPETTPDQQITQP